MTRPRFRATARQHIRAWRARGGTGVVRINGPVRRPRGARRGACALALGRGRGADAQGVTLAALYGHTMVERGPLGLVQLGGTEEVGDLAWHVEYDGQLRGRGAFLGCDVPGIRHRHFPAHDRTLRATRSVGSTTSSPPLYVSLGS